MSGFETAPSPPQLNDRPTKEELAVLEKQKNRPVFENISMEGQREWEPQQTNADLMGYIKTPDIVKVNEWIETKKKSGSISVINEIHEFNERTFDFCSALGYAIFQAYDTQRKIGYEIEEGSKVTLLSERTKRTEIVLALLAVPGINLYDSKDLYHVRPHIYDGTPLILAARWELFDVVEAILNVVPSEYKNWYINEIPIDSRNKDTALTISIKTGNYEIVKLLIKNGADVNKSNAYILDEDKVSVKTIIGREAGMSFEEVLAIKKDTEIKRREIRNREGLTPLILAARGGNLEIFKLLLDKGAEINSVKKYDDEDGEELTPLRAAIISLDPAIEIAVSTVLNKRETKDTFKVSFPTSTLVEIFERQQNRRVREILEMLIIKNYGKARSLIDKSDSIDGKNTVGFIDFISLELSKLKENQTKIIELLLSQPGIDVITPSNYGTTTLMLAASFGLLDLVNTLLEKGAEVSAQNKEGDSALVFAVRNGHADVVTALLTKIGTNFADNELNLAIIAAAKAGNVDIFNMLKGQIDINAKDKDGDTALIAAVKGGNMVIFDILSKENFDLKAQNNAGDTALIVAARSKHNYGDSHLIVAARRSKNLEIVKSLLLKKGQFDVNSKNEDGDTALHVAVNNNNVEIVRTLLRDPAIKKTIKNNKNETPQELAKTRTTDMKQLLNPGLFSIVRNRFGSLVSTFKRGGGGQRHIKKTKKNLKHKKSRRKNINTHK